MPIDTLAYVKTLRAAGVEEKIAEAHMEATRAHVLPELASKRDVQDLKAELKAEIERLRLLMERFHAETYQRMWQVATGAFGAAALIGLLVRFLR
jgi:alkylation response protein AidB-like acyl-CoA dehydrogenase